MDNRSVSGVRADAWARADEIAQSFEPRAKSAEFNPASRFFTFHLFNGCAFSFPADTWPELAGATADRLSRFEMDEAGEIIRWPELDAGFNIPGFILEAIGGKALWRQWANQWEQTVQEIESRLRADQARKAGKGKSTAKAAASRANGKKGGRPRKRIA